MSHGQSPSPPRAAIELASSTAETARLHDWLDAVLASWAVPERTADSVRLCLEEAVMNVVLHGYGPGGAGRIGVALWRENGLLRARVTDAAPAFDPVATPLPALASGLGDARPGGRGLRLIRCRADRLDYQRIEGENRLTLGFAD